MPAPADARPDTGAAPPCPDAVAAFLRQGNERYVRDRSHHPRLDGQRRRETARNGQQPFATVLACSDARVPVEAIFDQGIGDVFVVRVGGNVAGPYAVASIEYGVDQLGTPLLVVMGHTQCGAVTAAAKGLQFGGRIAALLADLQPAIAAARRTLPTASPDELIAAATRHNVRLVMAKLLADSPPLHARIAAGTLKICGAIYDLATGRVEWLGEPSPPYHEEAARTHS